MNEETLLHACERAIRFIRIDSTRGGGLLSRETIMAAERLAAMVEAEKAKARAA